jgi:hypothetical protein
LKKQDKIFYNKTVLINSQAKFSNSLSNLKAEFKRTPSTRKKTWREMKMIILMRRTFLFLKKRTKTNNNFNLTLERSLEFFSRLIKFTAQTLLKN